MNAKLFLIYLRIKPLLQAIAVCSFSIIIINQFLNYRHLFTNNKPWKVKDVLSGNSLTVMRGDEKLNLKLCGISGGDEDYLRSLISKGNGSVVVNRISKEDNVTVAEVFIPLLPNYETEIHLNTEMITKGRATVVNYSDCKSAEYLKMAASQVEK